MTASTWLQEPGRQELLVAQVEIDHSDMAATDGGTIAQGTYEAIQMPAGARVVGGIAKITEAFPASVVINVGDGDDPDRYIDSDGDAPGTAVYPAASSIAEQTLNNVAYIVPAAHKYTAPDTIDVVVSGAAPTASGKLLLTVLYTIEGRAAFVQK